MIKSLMTLKILSLSSKLWNHRETQGKAPIKKSLAVKLMTSSPL